jgi:hypothetical protein
MYSVPINGPDPIYDDTFSKYPSTLTIKELESVVKSERLDLYNHLKPCGAKALRKHLVNLEIENVPSVSTIGKILNKLDLINGYTRNNPGD